MSASFAKPEKHETRYEGGPVRGKGRISISNAGVCRRDRRAYGAGEIGEADAERLTSRIEAARRADPAEEYGEGLAPAAPLATVSIFPARTQLGGEGKGVAVDEPAPIRPRGRTISRKWRG